MILTDKYKVYFLRVAFFNCHDTTYEEILYTKLQSSLCTVSVQYNAAQGSASSPLPVCLAELTKRPVAAGRKWVRKLTTDKL